MSRNALKQQAAAPRSITPKNPLKQRRAARVAVADPDKGLPLSN